MSGHLSTIPRSFRWTALLALVLMLSPGLVFAGRKPTRRTLPGGVPTPAQAPDRATRAADPAVESAIEALRGAFDRQTRRSRSPRGDTDEPYVARSRGGHVQTLMAPAGHAYEVSRTGPDRTPEALALGFLQERGVAFGLTRMGVDPRRGGSLNARPARSRGDRSVVRLEQSFAGLRVFGAGAVVQVEASGGVSFALVDLARDDARLFAPGFPTRPTVSAEDARELAREALPAGLIVPDLVVSVPELMVYEPSVIGSAGPTRLVWHVRLASPTAPVNEVALVDAEVPGIAFHYSEIMDAKARAIYDSNSTSTIPGTLVRSEGDGPSGIADADLAYEYFGDTYDFYYDRFGRDGLDDAGATMIARVRYCEAGSCPNWANAYWDGTEMRFGNGYASADDVVAHELTHGVTESESNLIYWGESGAINEGLSDIFGELVDLTNSGGSDTIADRWLMGEDLPGGAIRNMADPTVVGDPDRRFSTYWYTGSDDNRGVHYNSGVANKLAYLLVEGGSFNGEDVTPVGITGTAKLFYEAQVSLLVPGSDYFDLYAVLRQAAINLGWSPADREIVERACRAVEIDLPGNLEIVFQDGFEGSFPGSWTVTDEAGVGTQWGRSSHRKAAGSYSAYAAGGGSGAAPAGGPYAADMDTWIIYGPFSLSSTHEAWVEFDLYLDIEYPYDDVFWGVSIDGDVFDGYAVSPEPDGYTTGETGAPGWAHELFNLREITEETIVGASQVWLAFNFTSDEVVQYEGAYVDNVVIKKAPSAGPFGSFDYPADGTSGLSGAVSLEGWALDDIEVTKVEIYRDPVTGETPGPNGKMYVGDAAFVPGLRGDVETAYPGYPFVYRAGWKYNLLSYFLPNGGTGTFTFHAYAEDGEAQISHIGSRTLTFSSVAAGLAAPTVTAPFSGQVIGVQAVTFSWSSVGGAAGYQVFVWDSSTAGQVFSGSLTGESSTSTVISLPEGMYDFGVRACTAGGFTDATCGAFGTVDFEIDLISPTGTPTVTAPSDGSVLTSSTVSFTWTAVAGDPLLSFVKYDVLVTQLGTGVTMLQVSEFDPTTSTVYSLGSGDYQVKVRACQAGCGPWSAPVSFTVSLPAVPASGPAISSCSVSGGNSLTCTWSSVSGANFYQIQVIQPDTGPGGGALTVAARQVSGTSATFPVPSGPASVLVWACNGDGCGPASGVYGINPAGPNPALPNLGTPMGGSVAGGPYVLFTWSRVPGDDGSNTTYRLYARDFSRQDTALDILTTNNFWGAYLKAEGTRYDALVIVNPDATGAGGTAGPAASFNLSGSSAQTPTMVQPSHQSEVPAGNVYLGWSPVEGAGLYEYLVASGTNEVRGLTPGLLVEVPLSSTGMVWNGITRACLAGDTCTAESPAGWGPWSNEPGGTGITQFTVVDP